MRKPTELHSVADRRVIARAEAFDLTKATGMVCARVPHAGKPDRKVTKVWEVDATTAAIIELAGHLTGLGIERVVLEATGVIRGAKVKESDTAQVAPWRTRL